MYIAKVNIWTQFWNGWLPGPWALGGHDQAHDYPYIENACSRIISLFFFILRFWNQILTCWSVKSSLSESSFLFCLFMNSFIMNSFSSSASCDLVYGFLFFLGFTCDEHQGAPGKQIGKNTLAIALKVV